MLLMGSGRGHKSSAMHTLQAMPVCKVVCTSISTAYMCDVNERCWKQFNAGGTSKELPVRSSRLRTYVVTASDAVHAVEEDTAA